MHRTRNRSGESGTVRSQKGPREGWRARPCGPQATSIAGLERLQPETASHHWKRRRWLSCSQICSHPQSTASHCAQGKARPVRPLQNCHWLLPILSCQSTMPEDLPTPGLRCFLCFPAGPSADLLHSQGLGDNRHRLLRRHLASGMKAAG